MHHQDIPTFSQQQTAQLLPFSNLLTYLTDAVFDYGNGSIASPERMVVAMGDGGVMLSMPATAADIGIHKLVNVQPNNSKIGLPTIHGLVTVFEASTGKPLFILDGPEVTGRRTASMTILAIKTFASKRVSKILVYGTGTQAKYHIAAINHFYPECNIYIKGIDEQNVIDFCKDQKNVHFNLHPSFGQEIPEGMDVVVTLTTSTQVIYDENANINCLIIGVGAFKPEMVEIGSNTIDGSDIYADDPIGARHEAGDLLQAKVNWSRVGSLAEAITRNTADKKPVFFKSVGTAAWDLAACRLALSEFKIKLN